MGGGARHQKDGLHRPRRGRRRCSGSRWGERGWRHWGWIPAYSAQKASPRPSCGGDCAPAAGGGADAGDGARAAERRCAPCAGRAGVHGGRGSPKTQATEWVLSAAEPLEALRDLSHNFPVLASLMPLGEPAPDIRSEIEFNQMSLGQLGLPPGESFLAINGRTYDAVGLQHWGWGGRRHMPHRARRRDWICSRCSKRCGPKLPCSMDSRAQACRHRSRARCFRSPCPRQGRGAPTRRCWTSAHIR